MTRLYIANLKNIDSKLEFIYRLSYLAVEMITDEIYDD